MNFMTQTNKTVIIALVAALLGGGTVYLLQMNKVLVSAPYLLAKQRDCTKTGLAAVQLYNNDNSIEFLSSPNFHYNSKTEKCYAYLEVAPYMFCKSARIVFDVDINKEVLTNSFWSGGLRYVDETNYPARIIDGTEYMKIRNALLELENN
jgi:hypothetical protein